MRRSAKEARQLATEARSKGAAAAPGPSWRPQTRSSSWPSAGADRRADRPAPARREDQRADRLPRRPRRPADQKGQGRQAQRVRLRRPDLRGHESTKPGVRVSSCRRPVSPEPGREHTPGRYRRRAGGPWARPAGGGADRGFGHHRPRSSSPRSNGSVFVSRRQHPGSARTKRPLRRYRTGVEGRISHLKSGAGLRRSRLKGLEGEPPGQPGRSSPMTSTLRRPVWLKRSGGSKNTHICNRKRPRLHSARPFSCPAVYPGQVANWCPLLASIWSPSTQPSKGQDVSFQVHLRNVVSTIRLFLLLAGGTAFAANQLGKNSVGTKQLKTGAVTPEKLSPASKATLTGPQGPQGPQGVPGFEALLARRR